MSKNTFGARQRTEPASIPRRRCASPAPPASRGTVALSLLPTVIFAISLIAAAPAIGHAQALDRQAQQPANANLLTVELPARIQKGEPASLILHVAQNSHPTGDLAACLAPVPLFPSEDDAADTTPALGADLGVGAESASQPGCVMGIAGVPTAPDSYQFTWEPDTAGRVNLHFTLGESQLVVPVDVASAPPNFAILIVFVLFVGATLLIAARLRHTRCTPQVHGGSI